MENRTAKIINDDGSEEAITVEIEPCDFTTKRIQENQWNRKRYQSKSDLKTQFKDGSLVKRRIMKKNPLSKLHRIRNMF